MKITSLIYGHFTLIHSGHSRLFEFAKSISDKLTIGVIADDQLDNSFVSETQRCENLIQSGFPDEVILIKEDIETYIAKHKPNFVIKGAEFKGLENTEAALVKSYGGKLLFGTSNISDSDIPQNKHTSASEVIDRIKIRRFADRHNLSGSQLKDVFQEINNMNIIVLGDLIVDEYVDCSDVGMSRENPSLVVTPTNENWFVGGAGIVAMHAASLGAKVEFITSVGESTATHFAQKELEKYGVKNDFLRAFGHETVVKRKYFLNGSALLRVNKFPKSYPGSEYEESIITKISEKIEKTDAIILADFNYGTLSKKLVSKIIKMAKKGNVFISGDSQSSSQIGKIGSFKKCNLISLTEYEARLALQEQELGPNFLIKQFVKYSESDKVFLKLGKSGFLIHSGGENSTDLWQEESIPALNEHPIDISGAGDSMLVLGSLVLALGKDIWSASLLAAIASAIQISRKGNVPITSNEIIELIDF